MDDERKSVNPAPMRVTREMRVSTYVDRGRSRKPHLARGSIVKRSEKINRIVGWEERKSTPSGYPARRRSLPKGENSSHGDEKSIR